MREERDLSVLRWMAEAIPRDNRWYPVFRCYLGKIAGRVSVLVAIRGRFCRRLQEKAEGSIPDTKSEKLKSV